MKPINIELPDSYVQIIEGLLNAQEEKILECFLADYFKIYINNHIDENISYYSYKINMAFNKKSKPILQLVKK